MSIALIQGVAALQVIGNVHCNHLACQIANIAGRTLCGISKGDSQLQQSQVSITIVSTFLTLLGHIILEYRSSAWIVSIQSIQDLFNV